MKLKSHEKAEPKGAAFIVCMELDTAALFDKALNYRSH